MSDTEAMEVFDDLDAFFSASNPEQLEQAAHKVAGNPTAAHPERGKTKAGHAKKASAAAHVDLPYQDLDGKFIAIDPEKLANGADAAGHEPFILVPANIHAMLPWWGWLAIAMGLLGIVAGVVIAPYITLGQLTSKLGDRNEATAQYAMRQLVIRGDDRTVDTLYDVAVSNRRPMAARLRAVDTLSLIDTAKADRALQRLELASGASRQVRDAAVLARRQRDAARTRERP